MYKVKINAYSDEIDEHSFVTEMPKIPNNGDLIGFYIKGVWDIQTVTSIVYEFDENNKFLLTEINCC